MKNTISGMVILFAKIYANTLYAAVPCQSLMGLANGTGRWRWRVHSSACNSCRRGPQRSHMSSHYDMVPEKLDCGCLRLLSVKTFMDSEPGEDRRNQGYLLSIPKSTSKLLRPQGE
jgi:hypothetical protein